MESKNKQKSIIKIIRNIILSVLALVILIYVIVNIMFWKKGMPERFFEYEVLENGTVEIDYYSGPFFLLNIPDTIDGKPVTSIGSFIFDTTWLNDITRNSMQRYVTAVHLPDTVEEIHGWAFGYCKELRTINIPSNLRFSGSHILADTKVRKLVFPEGITEIGYGDTAEGFNYGTRPLMESFADMKYLQEVVFPESLTTIGDSAFSGCTSLKSVTLPKGLKKICTNAFLDCKSLKKITIPDEIEEIKYGAFQDSGLTEANIPKNLKTDCGCIFRGTPFEETLEKEASDGFVIFNDVMLYKYCGDDENVVIPDGIESICDRAFWTGKIIKTVEIPESVKNINHAFQYSSVESIKLPNSIKVIDRYAFSDCPSLKKITIPASVEEIGDHAFENCPSLEQTIIEGSPKMGEDVFKGSNPLLNNPK